MLKIVASNAIIMATLLLQQEVAFNTKIHADTMNSNAEKFVPYPYRKINLSERDCARFWLKVDKEGPLPDQSISFYLGLGQCWMWKSGFFKSGYGNFWAQSQGQCAHRVSYSIAYGDIPNGMQVLHRCDNPACVNPGHLFLGTHQDNMDDKIAKGRQPVGDESGPRKHKDRMARGEKNGSRLHPERLCRGDNHPARLRPERMARGDQNGSRLHPELLKRGETHGMTTLNSDQVLSIRKLRESGESVISLAERYGVCKSTIRNIEKRVTWAHI